MFSAPFIATCYTARIILTIEILTLLSSFDLLNTNKKHLSKRRAHKKSCSLVKFSTSLSSLPHLTCLCFVPWNMVQYLYIIVPWNITICASGWNIFGSQSKVTTAWNCLSLKRLAQKKNLFTLLCVCYCESECKSFETPPSKVEKWWEMSNFY